MYRIALPLLSLAFASIGAFGQNASNGELKLNTQTSRLEPRVAHPGSVLTISGSALGRSMIEGVYLTDHRSDLQVNVIQQTDEVVKVRIPFSAKPGRQQLLMLTAGEHKAFLEMPLYVLIESADETDTANASTAALAVVAADKHNP